MAAFVAALALLSLAPAQAGNASACENVNNWLGTRPLAYSCNASSCPAGDSADGHVGVEEGDTQCIILVKSGPATANDAQIEASAQALCTANGGGTVAPAYDCDDRAPVYPAANSPAECDDAITKGASDSLAGMCCSDEKSVCNEGGVCPGSATATNMDNVWSVFSDDSCSIAVSGAGPYPVTTGCFLLPLDMAFAVKLHCDGEKVLMEGHWGKCNCDEEPNIMYDIQGSGDTCMSNSQSGVGGNASMFMTFRTNPCGGATLSGASGQALLSLVAFAVAGLHVM
mmetsp:Transcript_71758/g.167991  ORF Transcript_71758/g.167991 Transcript_71758/m.167991 type:complete len:284 (-) Transcript_71758:181-1032(-)